MALKYLTDIDLNKNELQNAKIHVLPVDPTVSSGDEALFWYNSSDHKLKYYDGTNIITIGELNYETSTSNIKMNGTVSVGSLSTVARADHIHPSDTTKADKTATVSTVSYDSTNKKLTKTINGTTTDIVTVADLKTALNLSKSDVGLGNVDNTPDNQKHVMSAGQLSMPVKVDGMYFSGANDVIHYGETSDSTATKEVDCTGFYLVEGARIIVKFTNVSNAPVSNTALDVNNTGAVQVMYKGSDAGGQQIIFGNGCVYEFVYDGEYFELIGNVEDTKNTAGSTDSNSKLYLIGATSQATNPTTYSHDTAYVDVDGHLYSNSKQVVNVSDTQALTNKTYNGYTLAAASEKGVDTTISSVSSTNLPTTAAVVSLVNENIAAAEDYTDGAIAGLGDSAFKDVDTSISSGSTSTNLPTTAAVVSYVADTVGAADAMRFKGTIGTGGTVTTLPTTGVKVGDTYRVITAGTYAGQTCEIGDLIIATATTPTWTVAQTNIDGAITSISGTSPISVTGSGASRTVAHENSGVTAASKGDTSNQTPGFGSTFKALSGTVNATGHLTAFAEHTVKIPDAEASTSAAGLMSSSDKTKLNGIEAGAEVNPTYTVFTGKPTANQTPGFGSTFTISQISQSANGQVSGTDRTVKIPNSVATSSANGLMSSSDKAKLNTLAAAFDELNPALTPSGGVCNWTISFSGSLLPDVTVFEVSTFQRVMVDYSVTPSENGNPGTITIKIISSSNIAANTYAALITGMTQ